MIDKDTIDKLPSTYGVYLFKEKNLPIYIGKSINIKARVKSHFENSKLDRKEYLITSKADSLSYITADCEFNALLLEAKLIKQYQPKYNLITKDGKSNLYIKITVKQKYPKIFIIRKEDDKESLYFGPFSSVKVVTDLLDDIRHIIPFCTQKNIGKRGCFYSHIGQCKPCPSIIENTNNILEKTLLKKNYKKNIFQIIKILKGGVDLITKNLYRQINNAVKVRNYEQALIDRNKIYRLERLKHFSLTNSQYLESKISSNLGELIKILNPYYPNLKSIKRIEGFDISNLNNNQAVGSMVVVTGGIIDKSQYRKFKVSIKNNQSDLERMKEVIVRRFNNSWLRPDLIIIDGGRPQVDIISKSLKLLNINIPIIGIAKNPDRLIIGKEEYKTIKPEKNNQGFNLVRLIRDESHRFARKYHLTLRDKDFLV